MYVYVRRASARFMLFEPRIHAYIHTYLHTCIHACIYAYIYTQHAYMHTYMYTYMYICTHINTHTTAGFTLFEPIHTYKHAYTHTSAGFPLFEPKHGESTASPSTAEDAKVLVHPLGRTLCDDEEDVFLRAPKRWPVDDIGVPIGA